MLKLDKRSLGIRYKELLHTATDGIHIVDDQGFLIEYSDSFATMLGYTHEEMRGFKAADWDAFHSHDNLPQFIRSVIDHPTTFETKHRKKDGTIIDVHVNAKGVIIDGQSFLYASSRDVTELKLAHDEMAQRNASLALMLDSTHEGLLVFDAQRLCIHANKAAEQILGYTHEELLGKFILHHVHPESVDIVKQQASLDYAPPFEASLKTKNGDRIVVLLQGRNLVLWGQPVRFVGILDITDFKNAQQQVENLAYYDPLTNLPNRRYLLDELNRFLKRSNRYHTYGALLFIDLDHFKMVNDTKGHSIGDLVLIEASQRISMCIRTGEDIVARLGGDEFVVLLETQEEHKERALFVIERVAKSLLDAFSQPMVVEQDHFYMTASLGIILFKEDDYTSEQLMRFADSAMYRAKQEGRNTYRFFDPDLQRQMEERARLANRLHLAVYDEAMLLFYQPQVYDQDVSLIVGAESLIRWHDPDKGMISPGQFIPIAEESGLIVTLGAWILHESVRTLKRWENDPIRSHWRLSVNISPRQFERDDFVQVVSGALACYGVLPQRLRLELTEGLLIADTMSAFTKIQALKGLGVTLSIDDFGTGYSSLAYLKNLPIDELKIDQSFIKNITTDTQDVIIVKTILSIGEQFGLEVIAEGVETYEQYERLKKLGCHYFQGYYFGRPMPLGEEGSTLLLTQSVPYAHG